MSAPRPERAYPIPAPASDSRFTFGLTIDVARVLAEHGYPPITAGGDLVELQQALFGFLYQPVAHDAGDDCGHDRIDNVDQVEQWRIRNRVAVGEDRDRVACDEEDAYRGPEGDQR